ncbi:Cyclin N-terminal domain-containing protein [Phytophthora infestans]|uniref:Cyclin N-terminal domain-containing protein n=1 Tax=Phytophthora infestans TaxID=4787 RepID=A0A8S9UM72_PHYIN|nr:Cyclin N-terminal domain-containing protein [Phytophthora infestans]
MAPEPVDKWVFSQLRAVILRSSRTPSATSDDAEKENTDTESPSVFHTPSFTESKVPWRVEQQLRRTTCTFIEHLAQLLEMPEAPSIAAQLFVQRFYMMHSFATHDRFLVATAALFLAGKTEEFPVKVRYVTECSMYLLLCREQAQEKLTTKHKSHTPKANAAVAQRHSPSPAAAKKNQKLDAKGKLVEMSSTLGNDKEAANTKHIEWLNALLEVVEVGEVEANSSKVLLLERILLLTLSFEIGAPQPFAYVAPHMEKIFDLEAMHPDISYEDIRQVTFMLVADAVRSGLILAFDCIALAAGAVYLACLYHHQVSPNVATEKNEPWWTVLQLPERELEEVARCYLWMYEDESGDKIKGLGPDFLDLWTQYRPNDNRPDLEYIKALDASLQTP